MPYPNLFAPGNIGTLKLPNRIIMGSMHLGYEGASESAERMAEFYAARASGGAALIITGGCAINEEAIGGADFSCIYKAEDVETLRHITRRTHEENGRIGLQLFHAGRYATREWLFGLQPVAPSAVRCSLHPTTPRAMNEEDISRTITDFANAAIRAREAGFDCIEIMGSEGYLINQFFSPVTNKRTDDWGGSVENRARFGVEVMRAIRSACGPEFPIIFRMSGIDLIPESNGWDETFYFARAIETAGADALNIGIGWHESRIPTISMLVPRGYYSFAVQRIKSQVRIPCICSNRINDPELADNVIASGKADFVSMARALLADPEFAGKAVTGKADLINTCIACNQACLDNAFRNQPTACILNPHAGRELETRLQPATHRKKIAVIGAGPAGLEASKILAERGHQVHLFEKEKRIGGQLLYAVQVPGKEEFYNTLRCYQGHLQEYSVRVEVGHSPTLSDLRVFDEIIIATGARPRIPEIAGTDLTQCIDYDSFFRLKDRDFIKSAVVMGAGGIGCDIAHILSHHAESYPPPAFFDDPDNVRFYEQHIESLPRNVRVTLTRRGKRIGEKLGPTTRWALIQLLEKRGVQMITQIQYREIAAEGLRAVSRLGKEMLLSADTIIFATGQEPDHSLYDSLKPEFENCHLIGAAHLASETNAQTAIWEAFALAKTL